MDSEKQVVRVGAYIIILLALSVRINSKISRKDLFTIKRPTHSEELDLKVLHVFCPHVENQSLY